MLESRVFRMCYRFQNTKIGWAIADIHAMLWWFIPKFIYTFLSLSTIILYPELLPFDVSLLRNRIMGDWTGAVLLLLISLWPMVFAFVWVVVLRRNFTVGTTRREFPYTNLGF